MRIARFAKMHVRIDEAWTQHHACAVDALGIGIGRRRCSVEQRGDDTAAHDDRPDRVETEFRIDDARADEIAIAARIVVGAHATRSRDG